MAERIITGKTGEAHVTSLDERVLNGSLLGRNTLYKLPWGSNFDISITGDLTARVGTGIGVFQGISQVTMGLNSAINAVETFLNEVVK